MRGRGVERGTLVGVDELTETRLEFYEGGRNCHGGED